MGMWFDLAASLFSEDEAFVELSEEPGLLKDLLTFFRQGSVETWHICVSQIQCSNVAVNVVVPVLGSCGCCNNRDTNWAA